MISGRLTRYSGDSRAEVVRLRLQDGGPCGVEDDEEHEVSPILAGMRISSCDSPTVGPETYNPAMAMIGKVITCFIGRIIIAHSLFSLPGVTLNKANLFDSVIGS